MAEITENPAQFTEMIDVTVRVENFRNGLKQLEAAYDDFLARISQKGATPSQVLDAGQIGALNKGLEGMVRGFLDARDTIVSSLGAMSKTMVESLDRVEKAIDEKLRAKTKQAQADMEALTDAAEKAEGALEGGASRKRASAYTDVNGTPVDLDKKTSRQLDTAGRAEDRYQAQLDKQMENRFAEQARQYRDNLKQQLKDEESAAAERKAIEEKRDVELAAMRGKRMAEDDKALAAEIKQAQQEAAQRKAIEEKRDTELAAMRGKKMVEDARLQDQAIKEQMSKEQALTDWLSMSNAQRAKTVMNAGAGSFNPEKGAPLMDEAWTAQVKEYQDQMALIAGKTKESADASAEETERKRETNAEIKKREALESAVVKWQNQSKVWLEEEANVQKVMTANSERQAEVERQLASLRSKSGLSDAESKQFGQLEAESALLKRRQELLEKAAQLYKQLAVEAQKAAQVVQGGARPSILETNRLKDAVERVNKELNRVGVESRKAAQQTQQSMGAMDRFWSRLTSKLPEFLAQIFRYSIGFQLMFGAIDLITKTIMSPIEALKEGVKYLTAIQDRTADIKEALLENVRFSKSNDWAENTTKAGQAAEFATKKIMEMAARAAIPPEKIEAGFKALIQGGGLKLMSGDIEKSVTLTAQLLSLMRSRGVSETNQRRAVTEINNLMTGQVKQASVLLQVLNVTPEKWKQIRQEAQKTGDLLGTHINDVETVGDRLAATNDRLENAQNRWKDLNASLEQYKNALFGAFAEKVFTTIIGFLQTIKKWYEEHRKELMVMANAIGTSVANMAKFVFNIVASHNPLMTMVRWLGKAALTIEDMLDSYSSLNDLMGNSFDFKMSDSLSKEYDQITDNLMKASQTKTPDKAYIAMLEGQLRDVNARIAKEREAYEKEYNRSDERIRADFNIRRADRERRWEELNHPENVVMPELKQPDIVGYIDKAQTDANGKGGLGLLMKQYREELEKVHTQEDELRKSTQQMMTERKVSVESGENAIIQSLKREQGQRRELAAEFLDKARKEAAAKGLKPEAYTSFQTSINIDVMKGADTERAGVKAANERIQKDEQKRQQEFDRWQEQQAIEHTKRQVEILKAAANEGYVTQAEVIRAEMDLRDQEHDALMAQYTDEMDAAGNNLEEFQKAYLKARNEMDKWESKRQADDTRLKTARRTEQERGAKDAIEQQRIQNEADAEAIRQMEQRGFAQNQILKANAKLAQSALNVADATYRQAAAEYALAVMQGKTSEKQDELYNKMKRAEVERDKAAADAKRRADLATAGGAFNEQVFRTTELKDAFKDFDTSVQSLNHAFQFFQGIVGNLINAWSSGYASGGVMGGIGGIMGQVGGILSSIPGGQIIGGILSIGGGIFGAIGSLFKRAAKKIAEEITKAFNDTMERYQNGAATLKQTIAEIEQERADAVARLSGRKGGKEQLDQLLPKIDSQLASLKRQQKDIIDNFDAMLNGLRMHSDALADFTKQWSDLNKQVKEYIDAGGSMQNAAEYMSLSLEKLRESYLGDIQEGEQSAIEEALQLNDLLQQRVDLVEQWKKDQFDILNKGAFERQHSTGVQAGLELKKAREEYEKQLADLDAQIDLETKKVDKQRELFQLSNDIAALHRRDEELQLLALDKQLDKIRDLQKLVANIVFDPNTGLWNANTNALGMGFLNSITINFGGITLTGSGSSADASRFGTELGQSLTEEIRRAYRSGYSYGG